eukprot:4874151-Prymnesium_polylepis.1
MRMPPSGMITSGRKPGDTRSLGKGPRADALSFRSAALVETSPMPPTPPRASAPRAQPRSELSSVDVSEPPAGVDGDGGHLGGASD